MIVTAICMLLVTDRLSDIFIYHRDQLIAGEYWRLISGHFVHTTITHMVLNLASWWLVWGYGLAVCNYRMWSV